MLKTRCAWMGYGQVQGPPLHSFMHESVMIHAIDTTNVLKSPGARGLSACGVGTELSTVGERMFSALLWPGRARCRPLCWHLRGKNGELAAGLANKRQPQPPSLGRGGAASPRRRLEVAGSRCRRRALSHPFHVLYHQFLASNWRTCCLSVRLAVQWTAIGCRCLRSVFPSLPLPHARSLAAYIRLSIFIA